MKPLLVRTLRREKVERPPVWIMRQAGRYLREYQAVREKHSFLEICRSSELAFDVSLQPMRILDPDAAIVFSDILLPLEAMGIEINFDPSPRIKNKIKTKDDIPHAFAFDPLRDMRGTLDTIRLLKDELCLRSLAEPGKAVLGFAGAPWTLACYLIDQGVYKNFHGTQVFAKQNPGAMHTLLELLSELVSQYLIAQCESGADAVQLFDTWGGILSPSDFRTLSLPYVSKVVERVHKTDTPVILYVNGSAHLLSEMADSGADCLSIDWRTDLGQAFSHFSNSGALQGNLDPTDLFLPADKLNEEIRRMLSLWDGKSPYIANLGHGILPETPRENAMLFVNSVKEHRVAK